MNLLVRAWHVGQPSRIHAVKSLLFTVSNIIERLRPEYIVFALDGGHTHRTSLFADYKAHRPEKPPGLQDQIELAQRAIEAIGWPMVRVLGWEADDVVASLVTQLKDAANTIYVVSSDKDLLQLSGPATIYHPWDTGKYLKSKDIIEKYGVKPNQISDYLALCGDKTDGVPGVNGIGPKAAAELLSTHGDLNTILEEARLLRIVGSVGKKLHQQRDQAILSRGLVELRADIDIPYDWQDWPATEPRAGWIDELRRLELGICTQRLQEVIEPVGRVRSGSPLTELHWEHCVIDSFEIEVDHVSLPLVPRVGDTTEAVDVPICSDVPLRSDSGEPVSVPVVPDGASGGDVRLSDDAPLHQTAVDGDLSIAQDGDRARRPDPAGLNEERWERATEFTDGHFYRRVGTGPSAMTSGSTMSAELRKSKPLAEPVARKAGKRTEKTLF